MRVVVPSGSLRSHLLARLSERRAAWLGLEVVTLRRLALAVLDRAGEPPPRGAELLPVLVRRAALAEPELARRLAPLDGGFAPLVGSVRDLLDAGLDEATLPAALDALAEPGLPLGRAERPRAAAVVRAAGRVARALADEGRAGGAALYRHAAERIESEPASLPPAAAILIHGFADATGAVVDLLAALARARPGTLWLDLPPAAGGAPRDAGVEPFGRALRERLLRGSTVESVRGVPPAEFDAFSAIGETAEAHEVARRIRATLAAGGPAPERIGVVARDLGPYLAPLRRAFESAAVPYSVTGAAEPHPHRRAALALVRLLDDRERLAADSVLDLLAPGLAAVAPVAELRIALRALGAVTLADLAALDLRQRLGRARSLALPVRGFGLVEEDAPPEPHDGRPRARRLARSSLARTLSACRTLARTVASLPERAPAAAHFGALGRLAQAVLPTEGPAGRWLAETLARLAADLPHDFLLGRDELVDLLARSAEGGARIAPGGRGGGVQILSVTAARGRTFAELFVLGLNRGHFPAAPREDALLGDAARRALRSVLPDLPVKGDSLFEERFLFDQLAAAAPKVTFSFRRRADDASPKLVSPLLDRLSWRDGATRSLRERWRLPVPPSAPSPPDLPSSPIAEALAAGLAGDRRRWSDCLPAALAEARGAAAVEPLDRARARARAETLAELDPDPRSAAGRRIWRALGPFLGRVGAGALAAERLWVTRVEKVHACGWQALLEVGLGLEPLADPIEDLPAPLDRRLLGIAVHRLLERTLGSGAAPPLADLLAAPGRRFPFPGDAELAAEARSVARRLLEEEGLSFWGFEHLLAEESARAAVRAAVDWASAPPEVLGCEVVGAADLTPWGAALTLDFRVDRVDRDGETVVLTDYKSWTPESLHEKVGGDSKHLAAIRQGAHLQPAAYVAALGGAPARGRFLALGEPSEEEERVEIEARLESGDVEALRALAEAARRATAALATGRLPPRLVDPGGFELGPACAWCRVAEACLQWDSGARRRLREWTQERRQSGPESGEAGDVAEADLVLAHPLPAAGERA